uniref:T-cell receptor alpha/delta variable 29.0 n=1 Tax=Neolamprologus brichardi TaxID=32507 RepID=A0A3Q4HC75_NEOBR
MSWSLSTQDTCKGEDKVIQDQGDVIAAEGDTVTLGCNFETTDTYPYLFWYKQEVNDFPKYVLRRDKTTGDNAQEFPKDRFDAELKENSVHLKIQKLQLSDSAVYYCALNMWSGTWSMNLMEEIRDDPEPAIRTRSCIFSF